MKFLAVDANSVLNRAFYGIKLLTTKGGIHTNGIYGFLNILLRVCDEVSPDAMACAFDLKGPTFRHERYDGYKAGRKGMPPELASQLPLLRELLPALGFTVVDAQGYEADDILGTLAAACCAAGESCVIATGDRDSLQLVGECVTVRLASTKMGRPETTLYNDAAIMEKYGVTPPQLIDVKALMGDASDNIPGVPGVGEKTALDLISRYGSVDYIYDNLAELDIKPGVRQKLADNRELCYLSRELAEICCTAPVSTNLSDYVINKGDPARAYALLAQLEMFNMIERLGLQGAAALPVATPEAAEPVNTLALKPATPELVEAALAAGELPTLFEFTDDDITAFACALPDCVLYCAAGQSGHESCAALLAGHSDKLRTVQSKALYRYGYKNSKKLQIVAFDAELAAYLLNPTGSDYKLDRLAAEYGLQPPCFDGEQDIPPLALKAAVLPQLCTVLSEGIGRDGLSRLLYEVEQPLALVLASMEWEGVALDAAGLAAFGDGLLADLALLEQSIYEHAGEEFNINSPKQLGEILFGKLGLPTRKKTKSGYSTNAEVLESLRGKHPVVDYILEYRKLIKLQSTYVEGLAKVVAPDGRVHTSFIQTETRTGRISSVEPNMQNIPVRTEIGSNLRKFFHAGDGCVLVDADYSQIELRVLAHISGDKNMIEAFRTGEDIHTQTASQVFGLPPLFVTPIMRSRAKAVNFGIVYGIGAYSLSQDIGVTVAEADSYIKSYLENYSGVREYMESTKKFALEHGYVATLLGRRRHLPEISSSNFNLRSFGERVAMNMPVQGTAADIIKIAMIRVFNRLAAEGLAARLVLQVHDELIVECPVAEREIAAAILKEEMEGAMQLSIPMVVDVSSGLTWYEAK